MKYIHKVQYYETDKMGITHHSNYIRFLEEARNSYLEDIGFSYKKLEEEKLYSPVLSVNMEYKKATTFGDIIEIDVWLSDIGPVRSQYNYILTCNGELVMKASTTHCIIDEFGKPVVFKKVKPDLQKILEDNVKKIDQ